MHLLRNVITPVFVLQENEEYFMVDGGGGSAILHQLKHAGIDWKELELSL